MIAGFLTPDRWFRLRAQARRNFRVGDQGGSEDLLRELLLGLSRKAEASSVRSAPREALCLVESRYLLSYFAANTPPPVFSCPATKAPVAAFSMR